MMYVVVVFIVLQQQHHTYNPSTFIEDCIAFNNNGLTILNQVSIETVCCRQSIDECETEQNTLQILFHSV